MSNTEIYYFSGTGNSLHVARELQKGIPEANLIPMVSLLQNDIIQTHGEMVGFVFPVHFATVPLLVEMFLRKLGLNSCRYLFAVVTRGGTTNRAFSDIRKILKDQGRSLDACFTINYADNNPRFSNWKAPTKEELINMEAVAQDRIQFILDTVLNRTKMWEKDIHYTVQIPSILLMSIPAILGMARLFGMQDKFYSDSKCTGCGICEQVCLAGKIRMIDNKPVWQEKVRCFSCRACINYCPQQAAQMKLSKTPKHRRYSHPLVTADDIARQKQATIGRKKEYRRQSGKPLE